MNKALVHDLSLPGLDRFENFCYNIYIIKNRRKSHMTTKEALKVLVQAGHLTAEEAQRIETRAKNEKQEKLKKVREAAVRAMTDYFEVILPDMKREEHEKFVKVLFDELEHDFDKPEPPKKDEDDELLRFLKKIGVA
jgi:hypothetical protein